MSHVVFSEYTEYEDELLGEPAPDDSSTLIHHGLYDDDETRARRQAWRKHVSSILHEHIMYACRLLIFIVASLWARL